MLEIAFAAVFVSVAFLAVGMSTRPLASTDTVEVLPLSGLDETVADLPCPWCGAPTREKDESCPSCGQPFG